MGHAGQTGTRNNGTNVPKLGGVDDLPAIITALGVLVVALTGLYTAQTARRALRTTQTVVAQVEAVHAEVRTGNGETIGMLADIAEGRAAQAIPKADRSVSEQEHVDMKEASERRSEL